MDYGPEAFAAEYGVSRETLARLKAYACMLEEWGARHNLVSRASMAELWRRHFSDSAQLGALIPPTAHTLIDLGSGAGFPGLVIAELLRDRADFQVTLTEATAKKCRFLEAVAARLSLSVDLHCARIEDAEPEPHDVVTARACAPLGKVLGYAQRFWGPKTTGLLLKGQNVEDELTEAHKSWRMNVRRRISRSDPSGVILEIRELHRAAR